jgi:flagellar operon protein
MNDRVNLAPQPAAPAAAGVGSRNLTAAVHASSTQASFAEALQDAQGVRFSNHAQKRLEKRSISLSEDGLARLASAVDKAGQRGGQESLVLMDNLAFIVNVRDRLVVTALDEQSRREGVFTQIDSVVFANEHPAAAGILTNPVTRDQA